MLQILLGLAGATTLWLLLQDANILKILQFYDFSGCFLFSLCLIFHVAPGNLENEATRCPLKSSL